MDIKEVLKNKTLDELKPIKDAKKMGSNLIDPSDDEVMEIIEALRNNKSYKSIKKEVKRGMLSFSYGQIKEIELAWKNKVVELTPVEEVEA